MQSYMEWESLDCSFPPATTLFISLYAVMSARNTGGALNYRASGALALACGQSNAARITDLHAYLAAQT